MNPDYANILDKFSKTKILVVGDFMLDQYVMGRVERISPEAPVPVVEEKSRKHIPGGAGNVVCNLHSIGVQAVPCGLIGSDEEGKRLQEDLSAVSDFTDSLIVSAKRPTTVKTRIFAANQQVCRIDRENRSPVNMAELGSLLGKIESVIDSVQGIILSDYDKGVMVPELIDRTVQMAHQRGIYVSVDPQVTHFERYQNVDILTPNHLEAGRFLGTVLINEESVQKGGEEILRRLSARSVLITRGEKGMSLIESGRTRHFPTVAREVFDVTGAGDTVISVFTAVMAAGGSLEQSVRLSNAAAGIVVGRLGAATVNRNDLAGISEVE